MIVRVDDDTATLAFWTMNGVLIDTYSITH